MTEIDALKGASLLVYALIYGFRDQGGFYGSLQYIAERTKVTKRTAFTAMHGLEDAGLIRCEERSGKKFWLPTQIHDEKDTEREKKTYEINSSDSEIKTQESEKISRSCEKNSSNNKEITKNNKTDTTPYIPHAGKEREEDADFDAFWDEYPDASAFPAFTGKHDRNRCRREYRRTIARENISPETILSALRKLKDSPRWRSDGGKYIPSVKKFIVSHLWEACENSSPQESHDSGSFDTDEFFALALKRTYGDSFSDSIPASESQAV